MKCLFLTAIILICFSFITEAQQEILYFPVTHRIVTDDSGSAYMQDAKYISLVMELLNRYFAPAKIQFYMSCDGIDIKRSNR